MGLVILHQENYCYCYWVSLRTSQHHHPLGWDHHDSRTPPPLSPEQALGQQPLPLDAPLLIMDQSQHIVPS